MSFIRNLWYIAAWDGEVASKPLARKICGEPIVMYRKLGGNLSYSFRRSLFSSGASHCARC